MALFVLQFEGLDVHRLAELVMAWLERVPVPQLKPFTMPRRELIVRAALNVAIVVAIAVGLSAWFATPLFLVGVAATAELAVRNYSANGVQRFSSSAELLLRPSSLLACF